MIRTETT
ncbi:Protein of unknown function [Bacillus mobilis]|nr:Protein of unknown function [Bacillus mobilis]